MNPSSTPSDSLSAPKRSGARNAKYHFGGLSFTAKKAVAAHAAVICNRHLRGATISDPQDVAFLQELFACNIEAREKRGAGIKRFYWDRAPNHDTPCFWIERTTGRPTEFGVPACLNQIGQLNRTALRAAVHPEIAAFRRLRLAGAGTHFTSDFSGKSFPVEEADADHVTPFNENVHRFFSERCVDIDNFMLTRAADAQSEPVWRDADLIAAFRKFHSRSLSDLGF